MPSLIPSSNDKAPWLSTLDSRPSTLSECSNEIHQTFLRMNPSQEEKLFGSARLSPLVPRLGHLWKSNPVRNDRYGISQSIRTEVCQLFCRVSLQTSRSLKHSILVKESSNFLFPSRITQRPRFQHAVGSYDIGSFGGFSPIPGNNTRMHPKSMEMEYVSI